MRTASGPPSERARSPPSIQLSGGVRAVAMALSIRYRMDMSSSRIPNAVHRQRPWRIHEVVRDFKLEDVWALPTPGGGPDDFPRVVKGFAAGNTAQSPSRLARLIWRLRWELGERLGWDDPETGVGSRVPSLRERLPADLLESPRGPDFESLPFTSLY